jgi:hypothetical protein
MRNVLSLGCLAMLLVLSGCARLLPASLDDLNSAEKVVLVTFRDGETLKGRIVENQSVVFQTFGKIYRGDVERVSEQQIVLKNAYITTEYDKFRVQRERMEQGQLRITDESTRIVLPTYRIVKVERLTVDRPKTVRYMAFWTFTASVLASILHSRL